VIFLPQGGLFGEDPEGIVFDEFLGIGGDTPLGLAFDTGASVKATLPFTGETELARFGVSGGLDLSLGLDVDFQLDAGSVDAILPFEVAYAWPTRAALADNPFFRLDGSSLYNDSAAAGFRTEWPELRFIVNGILDFAFLVEAAFGSDLDSTDPAEDARIELLNIKRSNVLPIINFNTADTAPETILGTPLNELEERFGTTEDEDDPGEGTADGDPQNEADSGPNRDFANVDENGNEVPFDGSLRNGQGVRVELGGEGISYVVDEGDEADRGGDAADERQDNDDERVEKDSDQKNDSFLDRLDVTKAPLATLDLKLPKIELVAEGARGTMASDAAPTYVAGTRPGEAADPGSTVINELANLNIDLDNIFYEFVQKYFPALAAVPGFEGTITAEKELGPVMLGAEFAYNAFDADLVFALPVNQSVTVDPDPLQTRLNFFIGDTVAGGAGKSGDGLADFARDADGGRSMATIEARVPRFSIYYNESNTFWDPAVAQALRDVLEDPDGTVQGDRVADDIAQFVDYENRAIPGAFTGQTGSIGGGFVRSLDRGATWQQLTTRPAETEYLARTRPILGADPVLSEIRPEGDAPFRYVIYRNGQGVDAGGTVDLGSEAVVDSIPVSFGDLVATDGVFEARLDAVTAPNTTTGFQEGAPSLDLIFPDLSGLGDGIIVEVEHVGGAQVANRTTFDFDTDIVLTALEASLGFYLDGLEALGIDLDWSAALGPLWQRSFDLIDAELAPL
jgi:hypothetical protein